MIISIVDNGPKNKLADKIYDGFADAEDVRFAVAYVSEKGWQFFSEAVENKLSRTFNFEIVIGLSDLVTEPSALETLYRLSKENDNVHLYCYFRFRKTGIYHPKAYIFIKEPGVKAFVGSSNLTNGGLNTNSEMNMMITANMYEDLISEIIDSYNRIKYSGEVVIPDAELLSSYEETYRKVKPRSIRTEARRAVTALRVKVAS